MRFRTKPFPHQLKSVKRALAQGSHAFFFAPRCGKTKAALDATAVLRVRNVVRRVVVIAPITAVSVWERELRKHYVHDANVLNVWGEKFRIRGRGGNLTAFFLINTDKLSVREKVGRRWDHTWADVVERWDPDLIIIDESHRFKRAGGVGATTAWHMVYRLRKRRRLGRGESENHSGGPPFVYLLTGTPNPKGYVDLFAQFRIMDEEIFGTSKANFEEIFCIYGTGRRRYTIVKYQRKKELLTRVRRHSTVVSSKAAGLTDEYVPNFIRLRLPPDVREIYERMATDALVELEGGEVLEAANPAVIRQRLLQITGGYTTAGKEIHTAKLEGATDFLSDLLEQGQSVVAGARFLPEVKALADRCDRLGYHTLTITGSVPPRDRRDHIKRFQERALQDPHVLVFQTEAGALSIELTSAAEVLFYSLPDRWDSFYQFIHRLGGPNQQHWPVRYTCLVMRNTVDMGVLEALRKKRDMHAAMMRDPKSFLLGKEKSGG